MAFVWMNVSSILFLGLLLVDGLLSLLFLRHFGDGTFVQGRCKRLHVLNTAYKILQSKGSNCKNAANTIQTGTKSKALAPNSRLSEQHKVDWLQPCRSHQATATETKSRKRNSQTKNGNDNTKNDYSIMREQWYNYNESYLLRSRVILWMFGQCGT